MLFSKFKQKKYRSDDLQKNTEAEKVSYSIFQKWQFSFNPILLKAMVRVPSPISVVAMHPTRQEISDIYRELP